MDKGKTFGRYAIEQHGMSLKENQDNGWLMDWRVNMRTDAAPEVKFTLDDTPILTGADATEGLRLVVTPMSNGDALPALRIPVNLMGDMRVSKEGAVSMTLRMKRSAMDEAGAGMDLIVDSPLSLECTVGVSAKNIDADPLLDVNQGGDDEGGEGDDPPADEPKKRSRRK